MIGDSSRPKLTYHFNVPSPFGYHELMSNETFTDYMGKEQHRTIARFYSRRMVALVKAMLKEQGVYIE